MAAKRNGSGGKDGPKRAQRAVRSTPKGGVGAGSKKAANGRGSGARGAAAKGTKQGKKGKSRKHPDPKVAEFGQRLKRLRDEAGKTQEDVARAAGLHWSYVGQIERGERNLTYLNILRLAVGLEVSPGRLVDEDHKSG